MAYSPFTIAVMMISPSSSGLYVIFVPACYNFEGILPAFERLWGGCFIVDLFWAVKSVAIV
jgi:hypothetical protein